jgi:hypothetical protein
MTEACPITKLNTSALQSALMVLKTFCSQINLHQATITAITVMSGSVTAYMVNPWNNTQPSGPRKDEKNSLADGASCPTSNTTFMPEQCNGGKRNPTTPDRKEDNPSGRQRQKKPGRGVKVDTATKEKKDLGMFTSVTHPSTLQTFSQRICPKSFALISLVREKSVTTLIVTSLTPGKLGAQTLDDHRDCQSFHQERGGMVQRIPFHEDA